jgi:hypothetical protein
VGSFHYAGINGAIWADPAGKDTIHVFAANNVPYGSQFISSGIEYAMPSGSIVSQSPTSIGPDESVGIGGPMK